jgi:7-keto-8-aminopelargonate synthetase-like enzyme
VAAAERALALNAREGDERRRRLAARVRAFRRRLAEAGLAAAGGLFPVQTLERPAGPAAAALHLRLLRSGVRTVLHRDRGGRGVRLSLLIRADHAHDDVLAAADAVAAALAAPLRAAG